MTFSEFIDQKGVKALALVFGVSVFTVYSWKHRGAIPPKRWGRLREVYPITQAQLWAMEAASARANTTQSLQAA